MIIMLSSKKFFRFCAVVAAVIFFLDHPVPSGVIAIEVFVTIISLFLFGSFKYQIHKNALTYGSIMIVAASFVTGWWPSSGLRAAIQMQGFSALIEFVGQHMLTLHGLDELIHADTMLFILGLTFFVCVIAQTRILESVSFTVLEKNKGRVLPTVAILTGLVAAASGVLDGVSMIGLMIRTLVIILFLAKADDEAVIFAVIVSTVITTVCGMWLAYGEPPNLIMKANLHPNLTNAFFLRYCLPVAIGSYLIVFLNLKRRLGGKRVTLEASHMDMADIRFLQVTHHGAILDPDQEKKLGSAMTADLLKIRHQRVRSQQIGVLSLVPFVVLLIAHGINHRIPLFLASFAGFAVAFVGIYRIPKMRKLALHEAIHEYREYLFLFPLFLSITLLQKSGFFNQLAVWLHDGIEAFGVSLIAFIQFAGACFLSALLDNNIVADFASRALHGLDIAVLHLFSMAQIAGYAVGGCWTHIGSAQSVVAYAFILKEVNPRYTPVRWMKAMTPVILEIFVLMAVIIFGESHLMKLLR